MASREVWTGKELRDLLQRRANFTLSGPSVYALINNEPVQVKTETLQALCITLQCTPNELYGVAAPQDLSLANEPEAADQSDKS
ncbi:hypothetical protein GCM10017774_90000 [Lentzea cavernae]|uniref:HTH cro/C1-type domain-containing protein n=2 Tax=Lentzea cavernae TaxID=2020703 RepID=A0ABQ3MXK9_9PSEU|nr:hypothetical protein GCM10017774_90000 [Lentzea cavernae]